MTVSVLGGSKATAAVLQVPKTDALVIADTDKVFVAHEAEIADPVIVTHLNIARIVSQRDPFHADEAYKCEQA